MNYGIYISLFLYWLSASLVKFCINVCMIFLTSISPFKILSNCKLSLVFNCCFRKFILHLLYIDNMTRLCTLFILLEMPFPFFEYKSFHNHLRASILHPSFSTILYHGHYLTPFLFFLLIDVTYLI